VPFEGRLHRDAPEAGFRVVRSVNEPLPRRILQVRGPVAWFCGHAFGRRSLRTVVTFPIRLDDDRMPDITVEMK